MDTVNTGSKSLDTFLGKILDQIINPIIILIALAAFILFAYGMVEFIMGAGEEEKRSTGKKHMIWGIVGLAIVFGAKAIVEIMKNIVGAE